MNKIKVIDDVLEIVRVSNKIKVEYIKKECLFAISNIKLNIKNNVKLDLDIDIKDNTKISFDINIEDNSTLMLNIITHGNSGKIQYKYNLNNNSNCTVYKFNNTCNIKEMISVSLNKEDSSFNYNFKTISNYKETYDYHIFHNAKNTNSIIKNNGVCINDGEIIYQVSSFVPKDISGCIVNQSNRIINLTDNKCEIRPILYIDNKDVEAYHSALIGKFSDEEMFYMQSRGLDTTSALNLLIRGFLTSDIDNKKVVNNISKSINKYWR